MRSSFYLAPPHARIYSSQDCQFTGFSIFWTSLWCGVYVSLTASLSHWSIIDNPASTLFNTHIVTSCFILAFIIYSPIHTGRSDAKHAVSYCYECDKSEHWHSGEWSSSGVEEKVSFVILTSHTRTASSTCLMEQQVTVECFSQCISALDRNSPAYRIYSCVSPKIHVTETLTACSIIGYELSVASIKWNLISLISALLAPLVR